MLVVLAFEHTPRSLVILFVQTVYYPDSVSPRFYYLLEDEEGFMVLRETIATAEQFGQASRKT